MSSIGDLKTGNPAFTWGGGVFDDAAMAGRDSTVMTVQGTAAKAVGLVVVVAVCAAIAWTQSIDAQRAAMFVSGGFAGGLILALVTMWKPTWIPTIAPLYSACQGFFLGAVSYLVNLRYPGIAAQAVGLTFATSMVMLTMYTTRMVRVTPTFTKFVVAATGALFLVYMLNIILRFFGMSVPFIHDSGPIGLAFSAVAIGLASMNLLLDFDFIEEQSAAGAPKQLEWFGAFGLVVNLVWLYIEILRLLMKLQDRR